MSQARTAKALAIDWAMSNWMDVLPSGLTTLLVTTAMLCVTPFTVSVRVAVPAIRDCPSPNRSATRKLPLPRKVLPKAK
ncbi:hypothetical protein D9M68_928270 [compost metagenome]